MRALYGSRSSILLLVYCIWSWSSLISNATWWLLNVPPFDAKSSSAAKYCRGLPHMTGHQRRFCQNHTMLMHHISKGINLGVDECKSVFRHSRWNCSTYPGPARKNAFSPLLKAKGKEKAFIHAMLAASVSYDLTKSCTMGDIPFRCSSVSDRRLKNQTYFVPELTDDTRFGHNVALSFFGRPRKGLFGALERHNREVGLQVVRSSVRRKCKCHGLSGSCALVTCYDVMGDIREISVNLKRKYDSAVAVKMRKKELRLKRGGKGRPGNELVFAYKTRTDFCKPNKKLGSFGTKGRQCNVTSYGEDGCDKLCCGRRHVELRTYKLRNCHCTFSWCCTLECQQCNYLYTGWYCR